MAKKMLLTFLITMGSIMSSAQIANFCDTYVPANAAALEAAHNHLISYQNFSGVSECLNKTLSLNFILITDPYYDINYTMADLNSGLNILNTAFEPICLSFEICNIDTVYEHKYFAWNSMAEEEEFQVLFCKENVINVILVGGATPYASSIGIKTPILPAKDFVLVGGLSIGVSNDIVHQMGHLFGLYHTSETVHGPELADGSNCKTAGDLVCDTPADIFPAPWLEPFPNYFVCEWEEAPVDANGNFYAPIFGNMMAPSSPCPYTSFTVGQYNRMIFYFKQYRSYLR